MYMYIQYLMYSADGGNDERRELSSKQALCHALDSMSFSSAAGMRLDACILAELRVISSCRMLPSEVISVPNIGHPAFSHAVQVPSGAGDRGTGSLKLVPTSH